MVVGGNAVVIAPRNLPPRAGKENAPEAVRQRNQLYNDSIAGDLLNHGSFSDSVIQRRAVTRA